MEFVSMNKWALQFVGFNEKKSVLYVKRFLHVMTVGLLLINTMFMLNNEWDNFLLRMEAVKQAVFYFIVLSYVLSYIYSWHSLVLILKVFNRAPFDGKNPFEYESTEQVALKRRVKLKMAWHSRALMVIVRLYVLVIYVIPIVHALIVTVNAQDWNDLVIDNLVTPYPMYYPADYNQMPVYTFILGLQLWYALISVCYYFVSTATAYSASLLIAYDLKSLCLSLMQLDSFLSKAKFPEEKNKLLKRFSRYLVRSHKFIYRNIECVNKGCEVTMLCYCITVSVHVCLSLYIIAVAEDFKLKGREVYIMGLGLYSKFAFDFSGEMIRQEQEKLHFSLYNCPWVDKPEWFKRDLTIIMIRTSKLMELRPLGLFVMNLKNFGLTLQAAYSYYNVVTNLKKD